MTVSCAVTYTRSPLIAESNRTFFPSQVLFGDFAEAQSRDFKEEVDDEEYAEDYGYSSDSDLDEDEDESTAPPERPSDPVAERGNACEHHEEGIEKGKVVKLPDIAFVT